MTKIKKDDEGNITRLIWISFLQGDLQYRMNEYYQMTMAHFTKAITLLTFANVFIIFSFTVVYPIFNYLVVIILIVIILVFLYFYKKYWKPMKRDSKKNNDIKNEYKPIIDEILSGKLKVNQDIYEKYQSALTNIGEKY